MPVYPIKILSLYLFFTNAALSAELDTQLKKIPLYRKLNSRTVISEDAKKAGEVFKQLWAKRNDPIDPNAAAKLYYQSKVDSRPCSHCPKYLNLTLEVNKIVEKAKADKDPAIENDTFIQLSKLKFLYYVIRSENELGEVKCQKFHSAIEMNEPKLEGNFNIIKDIIVRMPEISDFQLYPKGKDEIYYYYRGEGEESNIVIEVVMHKNGTANLRYYEFQSDDGDTTYLKLLQQQKKLAAEKKEGKTPNNFISPTFEVQTGDSLIPEDITLLKAGAKNQITEDMNILLGHEASVNEQTAKVVFERDNGQKWFIIQGKNITDGGKSVSATIPVEIQLDKTSNLKLNGEIKTSTSIKAIEDLRKGNFDHTQTATIGLKDENNEYLRAETHYDSQGFVSTNASNNFKLTEKTSIGSSVTYERSGLKSYSVSASTSLLGNDKLQTSFGTTSDQKAFVSTHYERKFSETGTLVLGTRYERNNVNATAGLKFAF